MSWRTAALGAALWAACAVGAGAQTPLSRLSFDESFPAAATAARPPLLVGLGLGVAPAVLPVDLRLLRVAIADAAGRRLCVDLATEDGKYRGEAIYQPAPVIRTPPALALNSRFAGQLRRYRAVQLLAVARLAPDCAGRGDQDLYVPIVSLAGARALVVQLGTDPSSAPRVWLSRSGAKSNARALTPKMTCAARLSAARSHVCVLPLGGLKRGVYALNADVGGAVSSYLVALP